MLDTKNGREFVETLNVFINENSDEIGELILNAFISEYPTLTGSIQMYSDDLIKYISSKIERL